MAKIYDIQKDVERREKEHEEKMRMREHIILLIMAIIMFIITITIVNWPIPYRDYIPDDSSSQAVSENN